MKKGCLAAPLLSLRLNGRCDQSRRSDARSSGAVAVFMQMFIRLRERRGRA